MSPSIPVLILARHGNTFEKGQTVTWVGSRTDLPLTAEGEAQGRALAEMIAHDYAPLDAILTGPLLRTKRVAEAVAVQTNATYSVDERLVEIDYGLWENKPSAEIAANYGKDILEQWEMHGVWPETMNWSPAKDEILRSLSGFLDEQREKLLAPNARSRLAITSNGILRFVYGCLMGVAPGFEAKVRTGAYCILAPTADGWAIQAWNKLPE